MLFNILPDELNYKIFEYYNWYQQEHKKSFSSTIHKINKTPTFLRRFRQRAQKGFIIYLVFESEKGVHYFIEITSYLKTLQNLQNCL